MIGFFPGIYPDELVFSVCSRYHERVGYRSKESTGRDLFGNARAKIAVDLPCNLDALANSSPWRDQVTADRLIDDHTLLPFYDLFMPPERLESLRSDMRGSFGGSVHGRLGALTSGIACDYLRFCPRCVADDRERLGETYWHRIHQVPGVEVCSRHEVFLENTRVHVRNRGNLEAYVTAERAVRAEPPRTLDRENPDHLAYLLVARDAEWLLGRREACAAQPDAAHRERYYGLLYERGFSSYSGPVNIVELTKAFKVHYSEPLLEWLGCGIEKHHSWIRRLIQNRERAQHPLYHLLLMQFLGVTASDFFRLPAIRLPFGEGPWPCLNRAAEHFGEATINEYELTYTRQLIKRPIGIFRCACGFAYYRTGPDNSFEDLYRADGLVTVGLSWERSLAEAFCETRPLDGLARHFCIRPETLGHLLVRLGLIASSLKGSGEEIYTTLSCANKGKRLTGTQFLNHRETRRKLWLEVLKDNPGVPRKALREKHTFLYDWLGKNDREWFESLLPPRQKVGARPAYIDWAKRDAESAEAVKDEAGRIRSAPGRPVRVSKTGVAKNIGVLAVISKRGNLLPLTVKALDKVSESVENYAVRRVLWAAECFREEGICPTIWQLQGRAAVSDKVAKHPVVRAAIESALEALDPKNFLVRQGSEKNVADFNVPKLMA
ncbi:MAG: TnsD family transposase [Acidobacteriota bacterium]|nr:TnsD family transposase [Acidobacteriota bacterium]MDQ5835196.1 TnsD family transposase [Acidobacteriota bacterium]